MSQVKLRYQSRWYRPEPKVDNAAKIIKQGDRVLCIISKGMRPPEGYHWKRERKSYGGTVIYSAPEKTQ